jgi:hypothetical protein
MTRVVSVELVGKCYRCGSVFVENDEVPDEKVPGVRQCFQCCAIIDPSSRGRNPEGVKIRWVGPGGEWSDERPTKKFLLSDCNLTVAPHPYSVSSDGPFKVIDGGKR